jgi:hypothetical protein
VKKTEKKRLVLERSTVAKLSEQQLANVGGGIRFPTITCPYYCYPTSCPPETLY